MRVAVIGAGIYGLHLAEEISKESSIETIDIFESSSEIMSGATMLNQRRVHQGYHYPRDSRTIEMCKTGFKKFIKEFPEALKNQKGVYGISSTRSKIDSLLFENYLKNSKLRLKKIFPQNFGSIRSIESFYETDELTFSTEKLRKIFEVRIKKNNKINLFLETKIEVTKLGDFLCLRKNNQSNIEQNYELIFDCTYGNLFRGFDFYESKIKRIPTTLFLAERIDPHWLNNLIIMDGNFFSITPFDDHLVSVSHVKYSHNHAGLNCNTGLKNYNQTNESIWSLVLEDIRWYIPYIPKNWQPVKSFTVEKVVASNEYYSSSRPIIEINMKSLGFKSTKCFSVIGSKIDGIFNINVKNFL